MHLLLVDPPRRTFAKVGTAVYHGGHDIIPRRGGPQARTSAGSLPLGLAPVDRSSQAVSVPPSLARTPRPPPPPRPAPLCDGHLLPCIPFLESARVCTRIRIGILVPPHLVVPYCSPHLLLNHPAYRPSPHTLPPRFTCAGPPLHSSLHSTHGRARAPKTFSFGRYLPGAHPTTKPKPTSSVARSAPRPMGSVTVLPPPPRRLRVPDYAESSRSNSGCRLYDSREFPDEVRLLWWILR
ncbi:hypothetical protein DFH08DRAFT_899012 [Mycena albidolilacea]|uniref:Uncharacterized protein n=1 Tax=Mycena albidolilacea TaxID=1033008 RepID=A0AAD6Z6A3_9AGAR|nr:hypothetical protein DFH08DRAFT_899012 [Mycena albidolilacea]